MQSSLMTSEPTTKIDTRQRCEHCHVPEGSHHPISNLEVALAEIWISGKKQLLCSRCLIRAEINAQTNPSYDQHSFMQTLKKLVHIIHHQYLLGSLTLIMFFVLVTLPTVILAQPGLPGAPDQAPIDGGLGILAALGGAYAVKKLRDSKK